MEQGLVLDELVEMKASIERGAQGESGGDQSPLTEGATGRAAVSPSSEISDGEGVAARREGGIPRWEVQQQLKPRDGSIIVGTLTVRSGRGILSRCLLYTSPSPRDLSTSRMPSSA